MLPGAITDQIDIPQLAVIGFFLFFVGLVVYLRREDRREGYPVIDPASRRRPNRSAPPPKPFNLLDGSQTASPHHFAPPPMQSLPPVAALGYRLDPIGDPLLAAVGPGTYVMRSDQPFLDPEGELELQPLRKAIDWVVSRDDADPHGMAVLDAKRQAVGHVVDLWVDREVKILRYLEVDLASMPRTVLVPIYATEIKLKQHIIRVKDLLAEQFAGVPRLAQPDRISAREEDQINAYYAGGAFFNREARVRP